MADLGMGLWGASAADTDLNENDNMSIDFDSFMQLLDEEPCHPEINLEDLSSSDLSLKYLFPGAGTSEAIESAVEKLEACSGNYCSADDANKMVGAPESSTSKQIGMEVGIPVTSEASVGSSIPHDSDGTFTDHMSSFTNCRSTSIHCNGRQSFNLDNAIPGGVKDEVGTYLTVENAYLESYSGCHISGTSTSSSFADNGVANVTEPDSEYGFDDPFLSLGKIYTSSAKTEAKGQPLPRNSLNMSTFSNQKPMVKYEMHDLAVANRSNEAGIRINSRLAEHDCLGLYKEEKEIDIDRHSYVRGCHQNDTSILPHVPASINEHRVREKDTRVGRAAAYNRHPHFKSICIEDKDHGTFVRPDVAATFTSNLSPESTQSNSTDCRYQVDDDSDICIIEEMSHPAPSNRSILPGKSLIPPKPGTLYDSHHHFGLEGSFKPKSEQIIFPDFSTLQDMSQQRSELDPPNGTLAVPLLRHQRIALGWMVQKESALNCSGGILADDQGLGKTVSTISLILKERSPSFKDRQENEKVHTLDLDEDDDSHDRKLLKSKVIKVDVDSLDASSGTASSENSCSLAQRTGRPSGGTLVVCPTSVLRQWSDELHNKVSEQAKLSVIVYHGGSRTRDPFELAKYDVVLTTYAIVSMEVPKQPLVDKSDCGKHSASNNKRKWMEGKVAEATAGPLAKVGWFRVILDEAQSIKNHKTLVARACWGLRAKRRWCLSGTPIQNAIDDLYSYFRFLRYDPYDKYTTFCSRVKYPIQSSSFAGYKNLQSILKPVMLRRTKDTLLDGQPIINLPPKTVIMQKVEFSDEERDFYLQLEADSQAQFKEYAAAGKVRENYVNILLMLLRLRQACDHPLLVKGFDASTEWKQSIEMVKHLPPEKQRHLLNCLEASLAICTICHDPPEGAVVSICGHVFCNQCISEQMTGDERDCPAKDCKAKLSRSSMFPRAALDTSPSSALGNTCDANEPPSSLYCSSKIRAALNALQLLTKPPQNSLNSADESNPEEKKKLEVPIKPDKAILFSQWTKMLDLTEAGLKSYGIQYRRLDGTMSVAARDKAVKEFNTLPEVTVMIMSLKAASLGLNMVAANHVLMMDLWWNPTTEDQAIDRAHRIGQTRPVTVLRLTVKETVEDRILELQRKKREMVESAFGEDQSGNRESRLTVEDLNYLFRV